MSHLHWMPLYVGDELAVTNHLTAEEFGAYLLLKMHYWQHGGLPQDDRRLERIARCSSEQWVTVREAIMSLFDEGWQLPRLVEQRSVAEEKHTKRVEAGRKGGSARRGGLSNAQAMLKQPQPQPQPQPYPDPQRDPKSHPQDSASDKKGSRSVFDPFPRPKTIEAGRAFLMSRGCPSDEMKACLSDLMNGKLSPYSIEAWDTQAGEREHAA